MRTIGFDASNHDNLISLVERFRERELLPREEAAEFTIGLKLFTEVLLRHRSEPLFAELAPHFRTFMKRLKSDASNTAE